MKKLLASIFVMLLLLGVINAPAASATSSYDDLLQVTPTLFVYTDGSAKIQKMDISETWWSEFKQTYAKRLAQNIGWPTNFVSEFEYIMSNGGSWGVFKTKTPDGDMIDIVGTRDPNAYCEFVGSANAGSYECASSPGYGFVYASNYTHNSFGGNGCFGSYGYRCSDTGMNIYNSPVVISTTAGYTFVSVTTATLADHPFFFMNFDLRYPTGYGGVYIPTSPPAATYAALGDSYSSAEGNPGFEAGSAEGGVNECHRSPQSYPRLLQNSLDLGPAAFVACSGATTVNMRSGGGQWNELAQVSALSNDTEIVTLTAGGNDVDFPDYGMACLLQCGPSTAAYSGIMANISNSGFKARLVDTYEQILDAAPNAELYVADYPYIVDSSVMGSCAGFDMSGARAVQTALNAVIEDAVSEVLSYRIHYVPTNYSGSPFTDGGLCGSGTLMFNGIVAPPNDGYSLHPNAAGQVAYAEVFEAAIA